MEENASQPTGRRTRPVKYPRGVSGKQVGRLLAEDDNRPILLLVAASNARNIVEQIVRPSSGCQFNLSAMSISGGTVSHGAIEIEHGDRFPDVSYLLLALGGNNMHDRNWGSNQEFESASENLFTVCRECYPQAQIFVSAILPQRNNNSERISQANTILKRLAESFDYTFVEIQVPPDGQYWSDDVHMSDLGLQIYMQSMEQSIHQSINSLH